MSRPERDAFPQDLLEAMAASTSPFAVEDSKRRVRDRLTAFIGAEPTTQPEAQADQELQIIRRSDGIWEEAQPGVAIKRLHKDPASGAVTSLWRLQPGIVIDSHYHEMDEECLVLQGELHVADQILGAGDFLFGAKGTHHDEVRAPHGALLLIRAEDYRSSVS